MRTLLGIRAFCLMCGVAVYSDAVTAEAGPASRQEQADSVVQRARVTSSSVVSIGFSKRDSVLEVEFRSGSVYRYLGVPQSVFEEFKRAESKGRYFAQSIRGKYEFQRVENPVK